MNLRLQDYKIERLKELRLKILLLFLIGQFFNLVIFNQVYTAEKKQKEKKQKEEVICVEAEGKVYFGELDYKKDVEERAKNDARRKAIEKAYGVFIKAKTIVHNAMLLDDLIEKFVRGKKIDEKVISSDCDKVGSMCRVKMEVCVVEVEPEKGESLNVEVYLSKRELKVGDEVSIIYKCDSDCYVNIFNVSDDGAVTLLFPNKFCKNNFCEKGKTYQFPLDEDKKKGIKLVAKLAKGKEHSIEKIKIIVTKKDTDIVRLGFKEGIFEVFTAKDTGVITDLILRLSRLDPTEWGEGSFVYEIRK